MPVVGVSLLYQRGYFRQMLDLALMHQSNTVSESRIQNRNHLSTGSVLEDRSGFCACQFPPVFGLKKVLSITSLRHSIGAKVMPKMKHPHV